MGGWEKRWGWRCQDGKVLRLVPVGRLCSCFFHSFGLFVWSIYFLVRLGFPFALLCSYGGLHVGRLPGRHVD